MVLAWFQFEPVSLDVNEARFEEEQDTLRVENKNKIKAFLNGVDVQGTKYFFLLLLVILIIKNKIWMVKSYFRRSNILFKR